MRVDTSCKNLVRAENEVDGLSVKLKVPPVTDKPTQAFRYKALGSHKTSKIFDISSYQDIISPKNEIALKCGK